MKHPLIPNNFGFIHWKWVIPYTLVLYAILPFGRNLLNYFNGITENGLGFIINLVFIIGGMGFGVFFIYKNKYGIEKTLLLAGGILFFLLLMFLINIPEERIHFLEYGGLGFLIPKGKVFTLDNPTNIIWAIILVSLIGTIDELIQWLLPERFFDLRDIGFNVLGGVGGVFLRLKFFWSSL